MVEDNESFTDQIRGYREKLEKAGSYGDVWEIVKDSVRSVLKQYRVGMMLFLDDLPLQMGAFHPVGTNNIVINRALLKIVEIATEKPLTVNAFVYTILLHEYLHAIGYLRETDVRPLVQKIAQECFGSDYIATQLARSGPWSILKDVPLDAIQAPRRIMEIVKDFEKSSKDYIA